MPSLAKTGGEPATPRGDRASGSAYAISALVCAVLLAIPFLAVTIPPITDLPQQTAQIRLLLESLAGDSPYVVQWWHPNKLGYLPLLITWLLSQPLAAGRLGVLMIGLSWIAALHLLARSTARPPAAAALASVFFFNHLTYWGLLNFVFGLPVFALWFVLVDRLKLGEPGWRDGLKLLVTAALLYSAHVLWLAAGLGWLVAAALARRAAPRALAVRLLWVAPLVALVLAWYPHLDRSGFVSETVWGRSPLGRLHPEWLLNSALGGLQGQVETILGLVVLLWLLLGWWSNRRPRANDAETVPRHVAVSHNGRPPRDRGHRGLALAGLLFVTAALCLPAVIQSTVLFASRWLPVGVVFLVLACPQPRLRPVLRAAVPYVVLASLAFATAATWIDFENLELDGLHQALAGVPPGQRVLGLDYSRTSERIQGFPFYHLYAYAQVLHGGELSRSFANFGSSLVVFRDLPRTFPWTEGLDWRAKKVRKSDMAHFQYVIIFAGPALHAVFHADEQLTQVTEDRPWRLYRIDP